MGVFNAETPKPHIVYSNDEGLVNEICRKAGYMSRAQQRQCSGSTTVKSVDRHGRTRHTGIKSALKDSQRLVVNPAWCRWSLRSCWKSPSSWKLRQQTTLLSLYSYVLCICILVPKEMVQKKYIYRYLYIKAVEIQKKYELVRGVDACEKFKCCKHPVMVWHIYWLQPFSSR